MALQNKLEQVQKLAMTQTMQQSLHFLQIPLGELNRELQELSMSNPFIDADGMPNTSTFTELEYSGDTEWKSPINTDDPPSDPITLLASKQASYSDYLNEQLGQMSFLDDRMLKLCRYIVGCLNSAGYLDCTLQDISHELGILEFDVEQALYIVQSLDPVGTGARSLSECLMLQLAQSKSFNELNIHVAMYGLNLISKNDYSNLAKQMKVTVSEAKQAASIIRKLNPIPSQGFYTNDDSNVIIPEVVIECKRGETSCEYNSRAVMDVKLEKSYCALVGDPQYEEAQAYLREKLSEAKAVVFAVNSRIKTVNRLVKRITEYQSDFFTGKGCLKPMTMKEIADELELSVSTVSRAIKDKYVQYNGKVFPIKSFFTNPIQTSDGEQLSASTVKRELARLIKEENPTAPLTDEMLCRDLASMGIVISRRTAAKYRSQLGIEPARRRKR